MKINLYIKMLRELMKDGYGISLTQRNNIYLIPNSYKNKKKILSPNKTTFRNKKISRNNSKENNNKLNERALSFQNLTTAENSNRNLFNKEKIIPISNRIYSPIERNKYLNDDEFNNYTSRNKVSDLKTKTNRSYVNKSTSSSKKLEETENNYMGKLHILENYISLIKNMRNESEIENKKITKENLKNNVDILNSNIRLLNKENKINSHLHNQILKENEILINSGGRANLDSFYINKELPIIKNEIENMKIKIIKLNEQTKFIRNTSIEIDSEIMVLNDEVKKLNTLNSNLIKDKEKIIPDIIKYKNSIEMIFSKIKFIEQQSNHFLNNVEMLVKENIKNNIKEKGQ